jgi:hypothetical protein
VKGLVMSMERNMVWSDIGYSKFKGDRQSNESSSPFLSSFLVELVERIKNTFGSVKDYTQISRGKFSDREFGEYYYRTVTEDIEKMDMVLSSLLNYMKVQKPIRKANTVHHIIEDILKKYQTKMNEKGIKVFNKFEQDLPETIVPDEQLKYVLSSVLQFAIASTSPNWSIGLSTRSLTLGKGEGEVQDLFKNDGRYIEIVVVFAGGQKSNKTGLAATALQKGEASDFILRFVKEVVLRNRGLIKIGTDEKKTKTFISLKFPVERRNIVYYQSVN